MKYLYKRISIDPVSGVVFEFTECYEHAHSKPMTSLKKLGEEGWKLIGSEYCGTKAADGGELKSSSIWIAMKEIDE